LPVICPVPNERASRRAKKCHIPLPNAVADDQRTEPPLVNLVPTPAEPTAHTFGASRSRDDRSNAKIRMDLPPGRPIKA